MTERDQDAIIGKAVREHHAAEQKLERLIEDAKHMAFTLERLVRALREHSPEEISKHVSTVLLMFETEKVNWSRFTPDSLKGFSVALKNSVSEVVNTREKKWKLGA